MDFWVGWSHKSKTIEWLFFLDIFCCALSVSVSMTHLKGGINTIVKVFFQVKLFSALKPSIAKIIVKLYTYIHITVIFSPSIIRKGKFLHLAHHWKFFFALALSQNEYYIFLINWNKKEWKDFSGLSCFETMRGNFVFAFVGVSC